MRKQIQGQFEKKNSWKQTELFSLSFLQELLRCSLQDKRALVSTDGLSGASERQGELAEESLCLVSFS